MTALLPWILVVATFIVIAARTRDGWVLALALSILVAVLVLQGLLPALR